MVMQLLMKLRTQYYMRFHRKDILPVLNFLYKYKEIAVPTELLVDVLMIDTGWPRSKVEKVLIMCTYCGLIEYRKG